MLRGAGSASRWIALAVLALAVLPVSIDATALALAVPYLAADLHPSSTWLLWIGDAYSFTAAALLVTVGSLADRIGRRRLFLLGSAAFGLCSVLAAYASTTAVLVIARVLLGAAGAAILPSTLAIIQQVFTQPRQRTRAIGLWAATAAAGEALGPLVGGALLEHAWWGSVFLVSVPPMAAVVVLGLRVLPESCDREEHPRDLPSVALALAGIAATMYAVKEFAAHGWRPVLVAVAIAGVLALVGFARRQARVRGALLDIKMLAGRAFSMAIASNLLATLCLVGVLFYVAQYLILVHGYSPLAAGFRELPATVGAGGAALLAGTAARHCSRGTLTSAGLLLGGAGLTLLILLEVGSGYPLIGTALLAVGAGTGLVYTMAADLALTSAPPAKAAAASGLSETAYELGAALGIALLGTVITFVYRTGLTLPAGLTPETAATAHMSLAAATTVAVTLPYPAAEHLLDGAQSAFVDGLRAAAVIAAILLFCVAVAVRLLVPSHQPRRSALRRRAEPLK
jgi:MFS transporter, DHA2 family, multidrug resistance protein